MDTDKIKVINQGTFGCILKPGITCEGALDTSTKMITKIQKSKERSANEVHISNLIKEINGFSRYFAPIIEACDVDVSTIMNDELRKCKFIEKNDKMKKGLKFEINKMQYVGKDTLGDYFNNLIVTNRNLNKTNFGLKLVFVFSKLLEGIQKLSDADIVHNDIKENNIMCQINTGRPIYIDFGLSIDIKSLNYKDTSFFDAFYTYGPDYSVWCFEINVISYLLNVIGGDMNSVEEIINLPVSVIQIREIIKDYISKHEALCYSLSDKEKAKVLDDHINYFNKYVNNNGYNTNKWDVIVKEMMKSYKTWDLFSLCSCFLSLIYDFNLQDMMDKVPFLNKFKVILKRVLVSTPDKRITIEECLQQLKEIESVTIEEIADLNVLINERNKNEDLMNKIRRMYAESKNKNKRVPKKMNTI